jgi:hypothetical protein
MRPDNCQMYLNLILRSIIWSSVQPVNECQDSGETGPKNRRLIAVCLAFAYEFTVASLGFCVTGDTAHMRLRYPPWRIGRVDKCIIMYYTLETERVYNSIYSHVTKTLGVSGQLTQLQITHFSLMPSVYAAVVVSLVTARASKRIVSVTRMTKVGRSCINGQAASRPCRPCAAITYPCYVSLGGLWDGGVGALDWHNELH